MLDIKFGQERRIPADEVQNIKEHKLSRKYSRPYTEAEMDNLLHHRTKGISTKGQLEPIVLYKGEIIDGRHRTKAALELGIPLRVVDIDSKTSLRDVEVFASSKEATRNIERHERAFIAAERYAEEKKVYDIKYDIIENGEYSAREKKRMRSDLFKPTLMKTAKENTVSRAYILDARFILDSGLDKYINMAKYGMRPLSTVKNMVAEMLDDLSPSFADFLSEDAVAISTMKKSSVKAFNDFREEFPNAETEAILRMVFLLESHRQMKSYITGEIDEKIETQIYEKPVDEEVEEF